LLVVSPLTCRESRFLARIIGGDEMKKIDRLEARLNEKVKDPSRDIDFSYLTDEELERESFKLEKLSYEDERSEHPEWTDEQIFQKLEDDLIEIMEEWGKTPEETAEMRELMKSQRPALKAFIESNERYT